MARPAYGIGVGPEFAQAEFEPLPVEVWRFEGFVARRYADGSADLTVPRVTRKTVKELQSRGFSRDGQTRRFVRAPSPRDGPGDPVWYWARLTAYWLAGYTGSRFIYDEGE